MEPKDLKNMTAAEMEELKRKAERFLVEFTALKEKFDRLQRDIDKVEEEVDCNKKKLDSVRIATVDMEGKCNLISQKVNSLDDNINTYKKDNDGLVTELFNRMRAAEAGLKVVETKAVGLLFPGPKEDKKDLPTMSIVWDIVKIAIITLLALKVTGKI